jgi:Na+/proline symporter
MSDQTYQIIAIVIYMGAMLGIGYVAFRRTNDIDDYMLAGRGLEARGSSPVRRCK